MNGPQKHAWRRTQPSGFSLVELLVAMGIMVVGLVMVGALFPTAIKQTESSVEDTLGTIICGNGLAVAKAKLEVDAVSGVTTTPEFLMACQKESRGFSDPLTNTEKKAILTEVELAYPVPRAAAAYPGDWITDSNGDTRPSTNYGSLVLARQINPPNNDWQIIVVAYKKQNAENKIRVVVRNDSEATLQLNATQFTTELVLDGSITDAEDYLHRNGVLILGNDGRFARIVNVDLSQNLALLDRDIDVTGGQWVILFAETDESGTPIALNRSPVMSVLVTRTALQN